MPSTVIRRFAYRADSHALDVEFVTGRVYRYAGVPPEVAQEMREAFAKGAFFNRRIRDGFPYARLPGWPPPESPAEPAAVPVR